MCLVQRTLLMTHCVIPAVLFCLRPLSLPSAFRSQAVPSFLSASLDLSPPPQPQPPSLHSACLSIQFMLSSPSLSFVSSSCFSVPMPTANYRRTVNCEEANTIGVRRGRTGNTETKTLELTRNSELVNKSLRNRKELALTFSGRGRGSGTQAG